MSAAGGGGGPAGRRSGPPPGRIANLHSAENRGLRELVVRSRDVERHHSRLAGRLRGTEAGAALDAGAASARRLIADFAELTPSYGLEVAPAAAGLGTIVAIARNDVADRFLERGQALRRAATDLDAVVTLLAYLARIAAHRADERMAGACARWTAEMTERGAAVRDAAIALGDDPDRAILPVDGSLPGRLGQGAAYTVGAVGEWIDGKVGRRPA